MKKLEVLMTPHPESSMFTRGCPLPITRVLKALVGCRFEPDLGNSRAEGLQVPWNGTRSYGVGVGFALLLALEGLQGGGISPAPQGL